MSKLIVGRAYKMLFVENYDAKSLDRSSVSMIDKYNGRLNIVGTLLTRLSALIANLLSLIRDIRNTLGQCKQRVYDNLNQVKEVISGNRITGTESIVNAIEDALAAGDKAIVKAEATLEGVQQEIDCNEGGKPTQPVDERCGENPGTSEASGWCDVCSYTVNNGPGAGSWSCEVCDQDGCTVNLNCDEPNINYDGSGSCKLSDYCIVGEDITGNPTCNETMTINGECNEINCAHSGGFNIPEDCTFTCSHSTDCHESSMPENCTYTCTDNGCNYTGNDCAYGTICNESCDQSEAEIEACGNCGEGYGCGDWSEFCGEAGGGTKSGGNDGCGECGDCGDCGNCGEGAGCGDWSEFVCGEI